MSLTGTVNTETVDNLAISFTAPTGRVSSFAMNILGDIYTTDSNSPGASLSITSGTASVNFNSPIDPSSASAIDISNVASAGFNLQATVAQINTNNPVSFTGTVTITNAISVGTAPDQAFVPSSILLDGTVADTSNSVQTTISATVSNPAAYDPASQDPGFALQGTLSVVVNLDLSGLPRAKLTVTVNKTGSDADTGNGKIIVAYDGETLTLNASQSSTSSSLTVTNTANASLTVSYTAPGAVGTGTVKVGSATVGEVTEIAGGIIKVSYNDGTFETLQ